MLSQTFHQFEKNNLNPTFQLHFISFPDEDYQSVIETLGLKLLNWWKVRLSIAVSLFTTPVQWHSQNIFKKFYFQNEARCSDQFQFSVETEVLLNCSPSCTPFQLQEVSSSDICCTTVKYTSAACCIVASFLAPEFTACATSSCSSWCHRCLQTALADLIILEKFGFGTRLYIYTPCSDHNLDCKPGSNHIQRWVT